MDEAAKASLPECMIAALSAKRLVLVGDHHQLLPFLDERILERAGPFERINGQSRSLWNNSLFKRMWNQAADDVKVLLTTHYRSRSGIRDAISTVFYDGHFFRAVRTTATKYRSRAASCGSIRKAVAKTRFRSARAL